MTTEQKLLNITNKSDELVKAIDRFFETGSGIHKDAVRRLRSELKVLIAGCRVISSTVPPKKNKKPQYPFVSKNRIWLGQ